MTKKIPTAKISDLNLIAYLLHKGFRPLGNPIEDASGIRYAIFEDSTQLKKFTFEFIGGNSEARLLSDFRKARSFLLDSEAVKETRRDHHDLQQTNPTD